jgi:hypothetical protein
LASGTARTWKAANYNLEVTDKVGPTKTPLAKVRECSFKEAACELEPIRVVGIMLFIC